MKKEKITHLESGSENQKEQKENRSATKNENTRLKYFSFLLELYSASRSKPFTPEGGFSKYLKAKGVSTLFFTMLYRMKIIAIFHVVNGSKKLAEGISIGGHSTHIIRWVGAKPTEAMAEEIRAGQNKYIDESKAAKIERDRAPKTNGTAQQLTIDETAVKRPEIAPEALDRILNRVIMLEKKIDMLIGLETSNAVLLQELHSALFSKQS